MVQTCIALQEAPSTIPSDTGSRLPRGRPPKCRTSRRRLSLVVKAAEVLEAVVVEHRAYRVALLTHKPPGLPSDELLSVPNISGQPS